MKPAGESGSSLEAFIEFRNFWPEYNISSKSLENMTQPNWNKIFLIELLIAKKQYMRTEKENTYLKFVGYTSR